MPLAFDDLPPLARAAVPATSTRYDDSLVLWHDDLPGGHHWSARIRRGHTLRMTDLQGRANVSALFYNAEHPGERYNMPDTLKAQHTAFLTAGHVCYSDMGRILCAIPDDRCGWHDTVCGALSDADMVERYGRKTYQDARNDMHRSGEQGLLIELGKWSLGPRDLVPNVNFFSKAAPDEAGRLRLHTAHRQPGQHVDLRFEMDCIVVLSAAPHPLDEAMAWQPGDVRLTLWRSGTAGADDLCRRSCEQNGRGYINTERYAL